MSLTRVWGVMCMPPVLPPDKAAVVALDQSSADVVNASSPAGSSTLT